MVRSKRKLHSTEPAATAASSSRRDSPSLPRWWPLALLATLVLAFQWVPLTSPNASIQWDAVDVHYSSQRYFAESIKSGELPFWTPYIFSGFPFLADPQVGAWYPPNWPFFLAGITPRAIQAEIALHLLLACFGTFFLARQFGLAAAASVATAIAYGLSGFFAGHASHVGMIQAAAWLPWLLTGFLRSIEAAGRFWLPITGVGGGVLVLAGHFQTSLYAFAALGLLAAVEAVRRPDARVRILIGLAAIAAIAAGVSAVQTLPGSELVNQSIRSDFDTSTSSEGALTLPSLASLVYPDALGAISTEYTGPGDITQYYFYGGILLLPLAGLGLLDRRVRIAAIVLAVPALWYALGPSFGLARVVNLLPGFGQVRAPVHVWFVVALGLGQAAGAGLCELQRRIRLPYVAAIVIGVLFADLFHANSLRNPMAYARSSFDQTYGKGEVLLREKIVPSQPPLTRFYVPGRTLAFGSLNHPLDAKLESTHGYNPLELSRYSRFFAAIQSNPALALDLNVTRRANLERGAVEEFEDALPRVNFPPQVRFVTGPEESAGLLQSLNPVAEAIVEGPQDDLSAAPNATASIIGHDAGSYAIRYSSPSKSLLRVAVPFYPGWQASLANGESCTIVPVDHALMGVIVPAGEHELRLAFHSNRFAAGAALSLLFLVGSLAAAVYLRRSHAGLAPPKYSIPAAT